MRIKKIIICLYILSVCAALSGCLPHTELDKKAIVEGIGIDRGGDGYEVTVQYFNMEGAGGTTLVDNTKANVLTVSGKGSDVFTALESACAKCGKAFMYGVMNVIVLGDGAAEPDLKTVLSFTETYYENNPRLLLAVSEGKASDVMNVKFKESNVSPDHIEDILQNAENMGLCECKRLYSVLDELRRPTGCTVLPLLRTVQTGTGATDDGKTVELSGGMLFSEGRPVGKLSLSALSGLQLLGGKTKKTAVSSEIDGKKLAITLYDIKRRITPSYEDGKLRFEVQVRASGKYADSQLDDEQAIARSAEAERQCAAYISERIENAVSAVNGAGCDPCGFQYIISSAGYSDWLRIAENYGELLKTAEFPVKCDINIDRFGLTS